MQHIRLNKPIKSNFVPILFGPSNIIAFMTFIQNSFHVDKHECYGRTVILYKHSNECKLN